MGSSIFISLGDQIFGGESTYIQYLCSNLCFSPEDNKSDQFLKETLMIDESVNPIISQWQSRYGRMKDYIESTKTINANTAFRGEEAEFSNKNLLRYLSQKDSDVQKSLTGSQKASIASTVEKACFMVEGGFNVCFHGLGSKRKMLSLISDAYTDLVPKLIVKGYSPATTLQSVLSKLRYIVSKVTETSQGASKRNLAMVDQLAEANRTMAQKRDVCRFILIVFDNIDGKQFSDGESLDIIAKILGLSYVRCVCSVDNVKFGLNMTPRALQSLNLVYIASHSNQPYLREFQNPENTFTTKSASHSDALKYIMRSLTKIQKEIIKLLAAHINQKGKGNTTEGSSDLDVGSSMSVVGLTLKELLEMCIDEMILSSEQQLKENLLEILDHKVFVERKLLTNQKTVYTMLYPRSILDKILNDTLENEDDQDEEEDDDDEENDNFAIQRQLVTKRGVKGLQNNSSNSSNSSNSENSSSENDDDEQIVAEKKPRKRNTTNKAKAIKKNIGAGRKRGPKKGTTTPDKTFISEDDKEDKEDDD